MISFQNSKSIKKILFGFLAVAFSIFLLFFCFQQIDLKTFWLGVEKVKVGYLLIALLLVSSVLFFNAFQFNLFLPREKRIPFKKLFEIFSVFAMMVNLLPFWGGHALLIYLLGHRTQIGKTVTLSALTLEQIGEGIGKLFLFGWVVLFVSLPIWMSKGMTIALIFILSAFSILFFLSFRFKNFNESSENAPIGLQKISHFLKKWAHHLQIIRSFKHAIPCFLISILTKFLEVLAIFMVQKSIGLDLSIHASFLMLAALGIAGMLPITPAQLGVFEVTALLIYQYLGVDATQSLLMGVFAHLVHLLPFLLFGYFSSLKIGFKMTKEEPIPEVA